MLIAGFIIGLLIFLIGAVIFIVGLFKIKKEGLSTMLSGVIILNVGNLLIQIFNVLMK